MLEIENMIVNGECFLLLATDSIKIKYDGGNNEDWLPN